MNQNGKEFYHYGVKGMKWGKHLKRALNIQDRSPEKQTISSSELKTEWKKVEGVGHEEFLARLKFEEAQNKNKISTKISNALSSLKKQTISSINSASSSIKNAKKNVTNALKSIGSLSIKSILNVKDTKPKVTHLSAKEIAGLKLKNKK